MEGFWHQQPGRWEWGEEGGTYSDLSGQAGVFRATGALTPKE